MASVEFHFEGKSALVTGAGRGKRDEGKPRARLRVLPLLLFLTLWLRFRNFIATGMGRATAVALHKAGAQVYALSKTEENLDSLKEEVSYGI